MISPTLRTLLHYVKTSEPVLTWRVMAGRLAPLEAKPLKLADVMRILLQAYEEALAEPRFEMPSRNSAMEGLLFAPIQGFHSVEWMGPQGIEATYTVEQYYGAMIAYILSYLRLARVDWLGDSMGSGEMGPQP